MDITESEPQPQKTQLQMTAIQVVNVKNKKYIIYGVDLETLPEEDQEKIIQAEKESIAEQERIAKKRKV